MAALHHSVSYMPNNGGVVGHNLPNLGMEAYEELPSFMGISRPALCQCLLLVSDLWRGDKWKCAEGRLENNNIMCAYHAWSFNSKGDLVDVPQAHFTGEPDGNARACASRRACVAAYPTQVSTWFDGHHERLSAKRVRHALNITV